MVAEGHFRKETRSAIDGGGVPPHAERAIPDLTPPGTYAPAALSRNVPGTIRA